MRDSFFWAKVSLLSMVAFLLIVLVLIIADKQTDQLRKILPPTNAEIKQQAIDLGYAEYNRTNGQWQWITNRLDK